MASTDLGSLRGELASADRAILEAVQRRLALAQRIGRTKIAEGLPVRDYAVEGEVLRWWRVALEPAEIPPERADQLARWLVEEAVRVQERLGEVPQSPHEATDILVVGGAGGMGRWLCGFLRSGGHRVAILDPRARSSDLPGYEVVSELSTGLKTARIIIVATPMSVTPSVYSAIVDQVVGRDVLLFDVLSVKSPLGGEIARAREHGVRVTSVHPLFGPATRVLSDRNLLVMDCGDPEAANQAARLFQPSALTVSFLPLEDHDPLMAEVLTLPHAVSMLFSLVLARENGSSADLEARAPLSYARQADVARIVAEENPQLSFELQSLNADSEKVLRQIEATSAELRAAVRAADSTRFDALLAEARTFWARPSRNGSPLPP